MTIVEVMLVGMTAAEVKMLEEITAVEVEMFVMKVVQEVESVMVVPRRRSLTEVKKEVKLKVTVRPVLMAEKTAISVMEPHPARTNHQRNKS